MTGKAPKGPDVPGGDQLAKKKSILDEVPYTMTGYNKFLDRNDYPGITPPWGTLNAVNLNNGKLLWKVPLGEYPELTKKGIPITGTELYGGPLVTKGGLVFIAASKDAKLRAFDKQTGKVLWKRNCGSRLRNPFNLYCEWKTICSDCVWREDWE
jgi:quinoprotein glucose dehydrogenase